jgi:hypothetical protein
MSVRVRLGSGSSNLPQCETGEENQYGYMPTRIDASKRKISNFYISSLFSRFHFFLSKKVRKVKSTGHNRLHRYLGVIGNRT